MIYINESPTKHNKIEINDQKLGYEQLTIWYLIKLIAVTLKWDISDRFISSSDLAEGGTITIKG